MSHRTRGRLVGALFLAAIASYGAGTALIDVTAGPVLVVLNSAVVLAIGALLFGMLRHGHPAAAAAYLVARALEAALLVVGVAALASTGSVETNDVAYQVAMVALGIGSVPLCLVLLHERLVPRWLAGWGAVGYGALAAGAALELLGVHAGLMLAIPGGVFEVVLAVFLLTRGFALPARPVAATSWSSPRRSALLAGLSLLLMAVLAAWANFAVLGALVEERAPAQTTANVLAALGTFRLAGLALLVVAALDVVVAWSLWALLDRVHARTARWAAGSRVLYAGGFVIAIAQLLVAGRQVEDSPEAAWVSLERFTELWSVALIAFGVHLLLVGWLVFRSGFVPRVVGVLVAVSGAGYLVDSVGQVLWGYDVGLANVTFVGEVVLMGWLLVFAVRSQGTEPTVRPEAGASVTSRFLG